LEAASLDLLVHYFDPYPSWGIGKSFPCQ
jgi:hypothetical protein